MTTPGMTRALTALAVLALAACSNIPPGGGGLHVVVKLESGLASRCVKVSATDGITTRNTDKMVVGAQTQLDVAIVANGMGEPVTVQALGFVADDCSGAPIETSDALEGRFSVPAGTVTLTLRPAGTDGGTDAGTDGGTDGGTDAGSDAGTDGGADAGVDAGTDAGFDAGVDNDLDTYVLPFDCDDTNPDIHPNQAETSCSNRVDDNCDTLIDCADETRCGGQTCAGNGTCVGMTCMTGTELCDDRADNDGDLKVDCADPDCVVGTTCNDGDPCTTGDACASDAGCASSTSVACSMPPNAQCWVPTGACFPDAGAAWCDYTMRMNGTACNDALNCTTGESCTAGTCGGGAQLPCNAPPTCRGAGACSEATSACVYPPLAVGTGACTDNDNCTVGDSCDGDGGCAPGTRVTCSAPSQCHAVVPNVCETDGGCTFSTRVGVACDAGTGGPAACSAGFTCVTQQPTLFPFVPSNFTEADLPTAAGTAMVVSCATTIDTTGTPSVTQGGCVTLPPYTIINQPLGGQAVLFSVPSLTVNALQTLTIVGTRPAIFAVTGNIDVVGVIRTRAAAGAAGDCGTQSGTGGNGNGDGSGNGLGGGGGGGFGSVGLRGGTSGGNGDGAAGATNGNASLIPLRGGCNGGTGGTSTSAGGTAGGALQLVAAGSLTITGVVTAPGRGGTGGTNNGDGGGGGGSGGGLLLEGNTVVFNLIGRLTANSGAGGEGHGAGGNAGKNGPDATEITSLGVAFGTGNTSTGGNGGDGAGQSTPATAGGNRMNNDGAGGGGGGLGRIKVRGILSCTLLGVSSPTPATECP